jgi:hypothetical protein
MANFPGTKIVHGRPRASQTQGSIERCNLDVQRMIACWLRDNEELNWVKALRYVQLQKNSREHSGIRGTPYKTVFGVDATRGIGMFGIPDDLLENFETEEQLEAALNPSEENVCHYSNMAKWLKLF